jgi:hypothetical protein
MSAKELLGFDQLRAKCLSCSHEFESCELPDFAYGLKLLRTHDGKGCAILHCIDNPVFDEACSIVEKIVGKRADQFQLARLIDVALTAACDPLEGKPLSATQGPTCPACGSSHVDELDYSPPRMVQGALLVATFDQWRSSSPELRESAIASKIKSR